MTRKRIALVCALAGLTLIGANVLIDAVATGFYNCYPDPNFPEPCMAQKIAYPSILVACWLVATYLLARREAIRPFACAFMGLMLWFGIVASSILSTLVIESLQDGDYFSFEGMWEVTLIGVPASMAVVGLLTAGVGLWMEATIRDRRRTRLPRAERDTGRMLVNGRRLIVVVAILAVVTTAGVFITSRGVQEPGGSAGAMVRIVVSEVDIPASTDLNELIKDDQFRFVRVPTVALIDGAVTSVGQLKDRHTTVRILAGEQILTSRIVGV